MCGRGGVRYFEEVSRWVVTYARGVEEFCEIIKGGMEF